MKVFSNTNRKHLAGGKAPIIGLTRANITYTRQSILLSHPTRSFNQWCRHEYGVDGFSGEVRKGGRFTRFQFQQLDMAALSDNRPAGTWDRSDRSHRRKVGDSDHLWERLLLPEW